MDDRPVLLIKGKGGFGNRILAACTGIVLADLTGRQPVIDWRDGIFLGEGENLYPLLFDAVPAPPAAAFDDCRDVAPPIWSGRLSQSASQLIEHELGARHGSPFVYRSLSINLARPQVPQRVAVFWSYLPKFARLAPLLRRDPRYRGQDTLAIARDVLARHFVPNARVQGAVDALFAGRKRPVIGVHIRHTDMKAPVAPFEKAIARLRRRMPGAAIFLATDSAQVQARIMGRCPDVFVIDKQVSEGAGGLHRPDQRNACDDPLREAENALIDLWALSRCDWLVHAGRSTFSELAALLGPIPARRQVDIDRFNPVVRAKKLFQARA